MNKKKDLLALALSVSFVLGGAGISHADSETAHAEQVKEESLEKATSVKEESKETPQATVADSAFKDKKENSEPVEYKKDGVDEAPLTEKEDEAQSFPKEDKPSTEKKAPVSETEENIIEEVPQAVSYQMEDAKLDSISEPVNNASSESETRKEEGQKSPKSSTLMEEKKVDASRTEENLKSLKEAGEKIEPKSLTEKPQLSSRDLNKLENGLEKEDPLAKENDTASGDGLKPKDPNATIELSEEAKFVNLLATEPLKAGADESTEPNYTDNEKKIKDYSDSKRYKETDLTPGSTIVENVATDKGVEKDGFKFDTLNPSKNSPSKT